MKLSVAIEQFKTLKLSLGHAFSNVSHIFRNFLDEVGDNDLNDITAEQVETFLRGPGAVTPVYHRRYAAINGLFTFAIARCYCMSSPLPKVLPRRMTTFTPYIYSTEDLKKLLTAIPRIETHRPQIEAETLRLVLLLLYGATLRISEGLSLNVGDVDLTQGVLTIRESKFYKTRLVPIGPSLLCELSKYARSRPGRKTTSRFFVSREGKPLLSGSVGKRFRSLRKEAGVFRENGRQPRIHDLRHTGAVHRVAAWYQAGKDVQKLLPLLSTYMGHAHLSDTQAYLTVTPEIMQSAAAKFAKYALTGVTP
jgi:site-specific recombinase XerD